MQSDVFHNMKFNKCLKLSSLALGSFFVTIYANLFSATEHFNLVSFTMHLGKNFKDFAKLVVISATRFLFNFPLTVVHMALYWSSK